MRPGNSYAYTIELCNYRENSDDTHLRLVAAELSVAVRKPLQTNGELDVAAAHDVLNLELRKLGVEAKLLDDTGILARGQPRVVLRLGTRHDHLARRKNECCRLRLTDTHDHGGETLEKA